MSNFDRQFLPNYIIIGTETKKSDESASKYEFNDYLFFLFLDIYMIRLLVDQK